MRRSLCLAVLVSIPLLAAATSVSKRCFGNGVCRVERDGVVSWEGPPDKVAEMQAKEDAKKQGAAQLDQAYAAAARRPAAEPIRLALVGPTSDQPDLEPLLATYRQMMEQALRGEPRIQLVPYEQVKLLAEAQSGDRPAFGATRPQARAAVDEALTRRLRDGGADVDVVLVVHLGTKKVSGLVSGGGGVGVAEVNNVEFEASLSSVYAFQEFKTSATGKSSDTLALAGIDRRGKTGSGELKAKRNPEGDRAAVESCAAWTKQTIADPIAPALPSLAAVGEIRAKNPAAAQKVPDWMKRLMKR